MPTPKPQLAAGAANPLGTEKIAMLVRQFSVPAVIAMLVNAIYNMVDQVFIGHAIGMVGIAATNVAFPITTISTAAALLLGVGGASHFNLRLGEGKHEQASHIAGNMLSMLALVGVAIGGLVLLLLHPLLLAFGSTENVLELATSYTAIIAPGIPFLIFATGGVKLIQADGSPNYAMGCMLAGAVFNLIFDPIFLFVFGMGIQGIALATTLGQILSTSLTVLYLLRRFHTVPLKRRHLVPQAQVVGPICALGIAACFNQLAITVVQIALNNTLRYYGGLSQYGADIPLAAVGAISKLNTLLLGFTVGIAQGSQPIISFNYGARQYARVRKAFLTAFTASSIIAVVAFAVFELFPAQLMTIFGEDDPLYLIFAVRYLRVFMVMTFVNGIQPVSANFFTSIGKARRGILISLTRQILFLLPLILLLPLAFGIDGVMFAGPVADGAAAVLAVILVGMELRGMRRLPGPAPVQENK